MSALDFQPENRPNRLQTRLIGCVVQHHTQVVSTNDIARNLLFRNLPDGTVVVAEEQTGGRGRLGRRWVAPAGSSILASFLLRPTSLPAAQAFGLQMAAAAAVRQAVVTLCPELAAQTWLKWPNDLLIGGHKVGGILTELDLSHERLDWAIIGLGLNVNFDPATVIAIPPTASSLSALAGRAIERGDLFAQLCWELEQRYLRLLAGDYDGVWQEWCESLCWVGQAVSVGDAGGERLHGTLLGVERDGALLLRLDDGREQRVLAGDLSLRLADH